MINTVYDRMRRQTKRTFPPELPPSPPSTHGWFFTDNQQVLARFLSPATSIVVELGCWLGLSTRFLLDHAPNATVIAVDHWKGSEEHHANPEWAAMLPTLYETFLVNCWEYRERLIPLRMDTITGLKTIAAHKILPDLVYIDASHDYESVLADCRTTLALFPKAILVGDDWPHPPVNSAVRAALASLPSKVFFT